MQRVGRWGECRGWVRDEERWWWEAEGVDEEGGGQT